MMASSTIVAIVSFIGGNIIGFIIGWLAHKQISKKEIENSERTIISFVVLAIWAVSVLFDIISVDYQTPFAIHGIFGAIVGYFYQQSLSDMFKGKK